MREFVAQGGILIADGKPGTYDEHTGKTGRRLMPMNADQSTNCPVSSPTLH
jgi:hypothetical protein